MPRTKNPDSRAFPGDCFSQPGWSGTGISTGSPRESFEGSGGGKRGENKCLCTLGDKLKISTISRMREVAFGQGPVFIDHKSISLNSVWLCTQGHSPGSTQSPRAPKNDSLESEKRARWRPESGFLNRIRSPHPLIPVGMEDGPVQGSSRFVIRRLQ